MLQVGIGGKGCAVAGRLRPGFGAARSSSAKCRRENDQGEDSGPSPERNLLQHSSTIDHNQRRNLCAIHCFTLSTTGLFFHFSGRISSDSARSLANISSIFAANSLLRITAFTSSLVEKLQKSMLVEPTVDQTLSMTAVFACSMTPRRLCNFTPDFRSLEYKYRPAFKVMEVSVVPGRTIFTSTPRLAADMRAFTVSSSGTKYAFVRWSEFSENVIADTYRTYVSLFSSPGELPTACTKSFPAAFRSGK